MKKILASLILILISGCTSQVEVDEMSFYESYTTQIHSLGLELIMTNYLVTVPENIDNEIDIVFEENTLNQTKADLASVKDDLSSLAIENKSNQKSIESAADEFFVSFEEFLGVYEEVLSFYESEGNKTDLTQAYTLDEQMITAYYDASFEKQQVFDLISKYIGEDF